MSLDVYSHNVVISSDHNYSELPQYGEEFAKELETPSGLTEIQLAAKCRWRVTAIIWRFLSVCLNPPVLN